jgi:hypothetical protein
MIPQTRTSLAGTRSDPWQYIVEADAAGTIAQGVVDTIREPLLILDRGLPVVAASRSFCSTFGLNIADIIGGPGTSPNCDCCWSKSYSGERL